MAVSRRQSRLVALAVWSLSALTLAVVLGYERFVSLCELVPGSSFFGTATFSMLGRTCTSEVEGLTFLQGPPIERLALAVIVVAWPPVAYAVGRMHRGVRETSLL